MKLKIEVGDKQKQIVAGIAEHYKPEELIGKKVVVVNNMKPTTIRGVQSEGMILVAKDGKGMVLLGTEKEIETGRRLVRCFLLLLNSRRILTTMGHCDFPER